jgi:hypothetical protein
MMVIDEALIALLQLGMLIAILVLVVLSILNRNAIVGIHHLINSRLDQLLSLTQTTSHAEGMRDQQQKNARAVKRKKSRSANS